MNKRFATSFRWRLMVLAILGAVSTASAVEDFDIKPIGIVRRSGYWFADARYRVNNQDRGGKPVSETDLVMNQGVELDHLGYFYHPDLVDWLANLRLGGTEDFLTLESGTQTSTGVLYGYDLAANILREKKIGAQVFASRNSQFVDRSFSYGTEQLSEREGIQINERGPFPALFRYEHSMLHEDSVFRSDVETTDLLRFHIADARDRDMLTELTIEREEMEKTTASTSVAGLSRTQDFAEQRSELILHDDWRFGPRERQKHLSGQLRFLDRTGVANSRNMNFNQSLNLIHSPTLSSFYSAGIGQSESEEQSSRNLTGAAGVRKNIYQSLVVGGTVDADRATFNDGSINGFGGGLDLGYTKSTPIGIYSSGMSGARHYQTQESSSGQRRATDQSVTLVGTTFVSLGQDIEPGSIAVTDLTHTIIFVQGIDYDLQTLGSITQIRRIDFGAIADPQSVFVSFTQAVPFNAQFVTDEFSWSHRIALKHLPAAFYFQYRRYSQELVSGQDVGSLDQSQSWLAGTEWNLRNFNITAEHEHRDEQISVSSDSDRASIGYVSRLGRETVLSAGAHYVYLKYLNDQKLAGADEPTFLETYGLHADTTTKLRQNLLLRVYGQYDQSRGRGDEMRARAGSALQWHYGRMDVSIDGYYTIFTQNDNSGNNLYLGLRLRRLF